MPGLTLASNRHTVVSGMPMSLARTARAAAARLVKCECS